ncbi:MAG: hypothetical protein WBH04_02060, partial [Albidovulum sp.]
RGQPQCEFFRQSGQPVIGDECQRAINGHIPQSDGKGAIHVECDPVIILTACHFPWAVTDIDKNGDLKVAGVELCQIAEVKAKPEKTPACGFCGFVKVVIHIAHRFGCGDIVLGQGGMREKCCA